MADKPFANDMESTIIETTQTIARAEIMPESPFLRIPGELRNEIYRSVVQPSDLIVSRTPPD